VSLVNDEYAHGALPKLYGAPAYARPKLELMPQERPFDPDDLPLESARTDDEPDLTQELTATPYTGAGREPVPVPASTSHEGSSVLRGRPFRIRFPGRSRDAGND
jgi:hypothetical protein